MQNRDNNKIRLVVPKIRATTLEEAEREMRGDGENGGKGKGEIHFVNWATEYPYAPKTTFWAGHNGRDLFLRFRVEEEVTMAQVGEDNGKVWTDSAVEFFISLDETGYYNFEFNCIGRALLGFRLTKPEATHGGAEIMRLIERDSSLGTDCFEERYVEGGWTLGVKIPAEVLFKHRIERWDGLVARGNFYKCGDNLSKPHYVSWAPVGTMAPDFHVPAFFGEIVFEK